MLPYRDIRAGVNDMFTICVDPYRFTRVKRVADQVSNKIKKTDRRPEQFKGRRVPGKRRETQKTFFVTALRKLSFVNSRLIIIILTFISLGLLIFNGTFMHENFVFRVCF